MTISRRDLLGALPAVALLPRALTAQAPRQLRVRGLHSMTLAVTDVKRSLEFYQGLFGMPIQARHGDTPLLRVGPGPKFMALAPAAGDGTTGVSRFGVAVEDFNVDRIVALLGEHGVTRAASSNPAAAGPLKVLVATRDGTPEIFVSDPSGVIFQLQDPCVLRRQRTAREHVWSGAAVTEKRADRRPGLQPLHGRSRER